MTKNKRAIGYSQIENIGTCRKIFKELKLKSDDRRGKIGEGIFSGIGKWISLKKENYRVKSKTKVKYDCCIPCPVFSELEHGGKFSWAWSYGAEIFTSVLFPPLFIRIENFRLKFSVFAVFRENITQNGDRTQTWSLNFLLRQSLSKMQHLLIQLFCRLP